MKKLLLIAVVGMISACSKRYEKPFVIYGKEHLSDHYCYDYKDKNGLTNHFHEDSNKYNIGDTIK